MNKIQELKIMWASLGSDCNTFQVQLGGVVKSVGYSDILDTEVRVLPPAPY